MTEVNLWTLHPTQREVERTSRRFNVGAMGRRWGKSKLGENKVCETALDGFPSGWFSPTYKLMLENWRTVADILQPVITRSNITERRIELATGGVIEFWAVDTPDVARGRMYKRVIIDEAAMIRYLKEAWENAIRPTLTDLEGDAWFFSTPKGRNYFWTLWQRGQLGGPWQSWKHPTAANPYIPKKEIEQARTDLPAVAFSQEYLAEFLENEGAVFRNVYDAAVLQPAQIHEHKRHNIVFGVDWGKHNDFTVVVGICSECNKMLFMDRFNQIDYAFQRKRLVDMAHRWKPSTVLPERNSMGEPIVEQLFYDGVPIGSGPDKKLGFFTSATTKPALIEELALAIEKGDLQILDDPILVGELLAYERELSASGRPKYNAPEGMHDDCVMALALAWNAASTGGVHLG